MRWNAAKLNSVWVGALFATAGAVLGNVLTVIDCSFSGLALVCSVICAMVCYSHLTQILTRAERKYSVSRTVSAPGKSLGDLYEEAYGPVRLWANACLGIGTISLAIAIWLVAVTNRSAAAAGRNERIETSQMLRGSISETQSKINHLENVLQAMLLSTNGPNAVLPIRSTATDANTNVNPSATTFAQ